jgi:glycosyltransferase involved in cell wall biosynthesis
MTEFNPRDVCFVGLGCSAQAYYRVMLPAEAMGCDWCGVYGEPPGLHWATGMIGGKSKMPILGDYKIVVLQQVVGKGWLEIIKMLRERGVIVIYECDDYVHGIRHMKGEHDYYKEFGPEYTAKMEAVMKACDAIIASTEWIAGNYSHFNANAYICENGIDPMRYKVTIPHRDTINIGWAGGTGHNKVVIPWFQETAKVMRERPDTCFVSIGQNFGLAFEKWFGPERALAIPFAAIEQYPGAMTMLDIALAPGGSGGFWRGKSDLRWMEAAVLGIPIIANPMIYPEIEDAVTGFHVKSAAGVTGVLRALVDDGALRKKVGAQAKEYVLEHRTIDHMAPQWEAVFEELLAGAE